MSLTRIVSQDEWSGASLNYEIVKKIKVLFWRDPGTEEFLQALSHEKKICPLIIVWRQMTESKSASLRVTIS